MGQVVFVGLGLDSEKGISLEGLEEARQAERVYAEFYTNLMPNLSIDKLQQQVGQEIQVLTRKQLEDENAKEIVRSAEHGKVVFLVPGDPMIATTHIALRLTLAKQKIQSRIIHGASIVSAISGATGLQSYKFGKCITFPQRAENVPASVLETITHNKALGLHTLLLLDIDIGVTGHLRIHTVFSRLTKVDPSIEEWVAVGAARVGSSDEFVKAGRVKGLKNVDFGTIPHCIVFPGKLHFMEEEALKVLDGASSSDLEVVQ
jgi:diphthine synthase